MARQLAGRLSSDGYTVSMVVPFPNRPYGRVYDGYCRSLRETRSTSEGYQVVRCAHWLIGKQRRHLDRLMENATFGMSTTLAAWQEGRPDVLLVETWPLLAVQLNMWLARFWQIPAVYYVKDVYPETLEYSGLIRRNGLFATALRVWDRGLCLRSGRVVVISEGMKRLLCESRRVPEDKVTVISDWLDPLLFPPLPRDNGWREEMKIPPAKFLVLFAGTLGHVSGAEVLVEVAQQLRAHEEILILCVGEGVLKKEMANAARGQGLKNIEFRPFQPAGKVGQMHASADVTLLSLQRDYPDASVPSKLITYLAAGRPVVCAAAPSSAVAQHVLAARAGVVAEAGDAAAIAEAILKVSGDPAGAAAMGENARKYFLEHFTLERACHQFEELLSGLTAART
jgi:colanic acid biosynthesis glycosyl transferase WcaI